MKNLCEPDIAKWRDSEADKLFKTKDSERATGGAFLIRRASSGSAGLYRQVFLRVVASTGMGWDHVSVSLSERTPTWDEMEFVKRLFFKPGETAMQLHVPASAHVNNHPYCLHLWRPHVGEIPRPPAELVGIAGLSPEQTKLALGGAASP